METKQEYWEGLAAGSFFLVATGAMMFIVLAVLDLAGANVAAELNGWASLVALVFGAIGGLLLMVEAGNKAKAYLIIANPASMASKNAIMMTSFMGFAFVYATFFFGFIPWAGLIGLKTVVACVGILIALLAVIIPALELGESRGRAFWNASGLIPVFLITALVSGLAAVLLTATILGIIQNAAILIADKVLFALLILQLTTVLGYVKGMEHAGAAEARKAAKNILQGDFKGGFYGCVIVLGTILPMILLMFGAAPAIMIIKTVLILIGGFCFRNIFLLAAVRKALPGEENEWVSHEEAAHLAIQLEKRWQEKAVWLYPNK